MENKKAAPKYQFIDGNIVCTFPVSPRLAKSGKSMLLATTGGAESVEHDGMDVQFNVNIYVPIAQWEKLAKAPKAKK